MFLRISCYIVGATMQLARVECGSVLTHDLHSAAISSPLASPFPVPHVHVTTLICHTWLHCCRAAQNLLCFNIS